MTRLFTLRNLILKAKHAYYYSGEPIISDAEYDALEDELRLLAPDDPVLGLVGSPVPGEAMLTKARHSIPMGSQSKVNSEGEFRTWWSKVGAAVHASLKGDGASAAAYYRGGRLVQAISRGDGTIGEDITANAMRFKGLPAWVPATGEDAGEGFTGAVRFEVILTIEDWAVIDPARSKNPRNAGTGIMGRKNGHQSDFLTIFAFDLDETRANAPVSFASETAKSVRLAELGFSVMPYQRCPDADGAIGYFRQIVQTRGALPFWIDGVVMKLDDLAVQRKLGVTSGRPKGQIAWKFDSSGAESVLEDVTVSGGHTGGLYPTAQLTPVEIGGTTVSSASLANYDEITRLDVAIGDAVWVIKANDIIPKIIRVIDRPATRTPIVPPAVCPFCGGEVSRRRTTSGGDGVIIECRNAKCPKKSSGKIRRWIASLEILGIGDSVLEALLERFELEDAAGLYTLRARSAELANLVINVEKDIRLGEKRATAILDEIDGTRMLSVSQFLGSLGLDYLGKRRVELMIKAADGALDTLADWRSGRLREPTFAAKAGVPNIGAQMQDGIDAMSTAIDNLLAAGVQVQVPPPDFADLNGTGVSAPARAARRSVCISGKLQSGRKKSDYAEPLRVVGYELVDDVERGLSLLVLADPESDSTKAQKARKLGVEIISEEQLVQLVQRSRPADPKQSPKPPTQAERHKSVKQRRTSSRTDIAMASKGTTVQQSGNFRRFEFVDGKSSKSWEIRVTGAATEVRYGRIGAAGQTKVKELGDAASAHKSAEKLIAEKLREGYRQTTAAASAGDTAPKAVAKPAKVAAPVKSDKPIKSGRPPAARTPTKTVATPRAAAAAASKTLCISGKLSSGKKKGDYEVPLRAVGITLVDDVGTGLDYLVLADPASTSSKAEKARKMGIALLSESDLIALAGM